MSVTEIILLIIAIALLILSCVMVDMDKKDKSAEQSREEKLILTKEEKEAITAQLNEMVSETVANHMIDTDDKLSQITNEKIMAINEFSSQILEKMELNHKEVVFLYDTLCQKQDEIKTTYSKMETIRRANKEFLEKLANLMANKGKTKPVEKEEDKKIGLLHDDFLSEKKSIEETKESQQEADSRPIEVLEENSESAKVKQVSDVKETEISKSRDKKQEILKLHKQKVSITDISKSLHIGQGEVKLIIDLYAKKN